MLNVTVIGTGYVGLVGGTCMSELGHRVVCVDNDARKIDTLLSGRLPIYEPGLEEMVPRNVEAGRLQFTTELGPPVAASDVVFIAVGTPPGEDGSADLKHVMAVARAIGPSLTGYTVVVVKSTVPIGTCDKVRALVAESTSAEFDVVSNPEFLREGVAVLDFVQPDRVVVGTDSERARRMMERLYRPLTQAGTKLLVMDIRSSEMTKYASNSMLATRISFTNEIANLCELVGADVENVRRGMGADTRIGPHFLRAGIGYGGSCFPKDVQALMRTAEEYDSPMRILRVVEDVNAAQKARLAEIVINAFGGDLRGKRLAMWGLAFKPDTDDMREAPSRVIAPLLVQHGASVVAFDPAATETARAEIGDIIEYADDHYGCLEGADALLLVTEWKLFTSPNWDRIREALREPRIFDGRNLWDPEVMQEQGLIYRGIGRPLR